MGRERGEVEVEVEGRRRGGWLRWVEIEMNVASLQSFLVLGGGLICAAIDVRCRANAAKTSRTLTAGTVPVLLFGDGGLGWWRQNFKASKYD